MTESASNNNNSSSHKYFLKTQKKAVIQVDFDTLDVLSACYQLSSNRSKDYLLHEGLERMSCFFGNAGIAVTLFLAGQTVKNSDNRRAISRFINEASFPLEIASHSMTHPYAFQRLPYNKKKEEIFLSRKILQDTLEVDVFGFKAPSYGFSPDMPEMLQNEGYLYDSSLWPSTMILPMKFVSGNMGNYGSFLHLFRPNKPFRLREKLWEIPLSCTPLLRLPLHSSYLLALGNVYSKILRPALHFLPFLCYSFHLVDFVEVRDPHLKKLRGYHLNLKEKQKRLEIILDTIMNDYTIVKGIDYLRESNE